MKTCKRCKVEKPFEDFHKCKAVKSGLSANCKGCSNERTREWKARNKDKVSAYNKKYSSDNEDRIKARKAEYRKNNRDSIISYSRAYYAGNRDKAKAYYESNTDVFRANKHKRRARLTDTTSDTWQASEVFESANWQCFYCGIEVEPRQDTKTYQTNEAHADHFTPLSNGGTNERKNIVCSCGQCNLSKGSKNPFEFIRDNINQIGGV